MFIAEHIEGKPNSALQLCNVIVMEIVMDLAVSA
jgi:hypothetical protein